MTYKKILVPVDFSDCSYNALEYALNFAESNEAKLVLLHAYHVPIPAAETGVYVDVNITDDFEEDIKKKIQELYQRYPQLEKLSDPYKVKVSFASDAILKEIEEHSYDLVIMGTHGATNTFDELVGSNTLHVVKGSGTPVLAIPYNFKGFKIEEILFAFDYRQIGTMKMVEPLVQFALNFGAQVHILHITDKLEKLHEGAIAEAKTLERYFKDISHTYQMLEGEHIESGVLDYIETHDIDVLAVMPRKHTLFEKLFHSSVTKQLVHHSNIPLLAFHQEE